MITGVGTLWAMPVSSCPRSSCRSRTGSPASSPTHHGTGPNRSDWRITPPPRYNNRFWHSQQSASLALWSVLIHGQELSICGRLYGRWDRYRSPLAPQMTHNPLRLILLRSGHFILVCAKRTSNDDLSNPRTRRILELY